MEKLAGWQAMCCPMPDPRPSPRHAVLEEDDWVVLSPEDSEFAVSESEPVVALDVALHKASHTTPVPAVTMAWLSAPWSGPCVAYGGRAFMRVHAQTQTRIATIRAGPSPPIRHKRGHRDRHGGGHGPVLV